MKNFEDLIKILKCGFELRNKFDNETKKLQERSHTIFTLNLIQKDKENDNLPFLNACI